MFESWGRLVYRRRRLMLVVALLAVAFAAVWGTGVFSRLQSSGGFTPPDSQSQQAAWPRPGSAAMPATWWCCTPARTRRSGRPGSARR